MVIDFWYMLKSAWLKNFMKINLHVILCFTSLAEYYFQQ